MRHRLLCAWLLAIGLVLPTALVATPVAAGAATASQGALSPQAVTGSLVRVRLRTAIRHLPVARETRAGYARSKFRLWVDADHDCRDTRDEVLASESKVAVHGCDVQRGLWVSYYDHARFRRSSGMDIDHLVPLAEAWDSGGRRWSAGTRERYANDLGDPRTLVAVSAHANRSKGDRDPADWQPRYGKCRYVGQWVAVKLRWHLKVDRAEKRALASRAAHCRNVVIRVRHARITLGGTSGGGGGTGGSGGQDPRFGTCTEAIAHGYGPYYQGRDPEYPWYEDRDHDGIVCE